MNNRELAKKIWASILKDLDGRKGFDEWWDRISDEIQAEISERQEELILGHLSWAPQ